ncbi:MAG TPA: tetratricopeptide repeat protein [Bryobacteraceae bacterium]|nr:tetratricopeptide repeat protein [Bryobacteraceae bacterium]
MPKDAEPHYQLALAYLGSGSMQAAASELMTAVRLDPKHIAAGLKLAELMAINNDRNVAKQGYDKAEEILAASPGNADALWTVAVAELRLEDSTEAVKHLQEALAAAPQHLNSSIMLAAVKLRANDIPGAEQILEKGAADAPNSAEHAFVLGRFYAAIQKTAEAEKQLRRAAELDPNNGMNWVALGSLLYHESKIDEADKAFQRASSVPDKKYRPVHAVFLFQTKQPDAAIRELEQQYREDTNDRGARTRLMVAYYKTGRQAEAEKVLAESLKRNPKDTDGLMQRAALNLAAGKIQDAQNDVTEVLRTHSDSAPAHLLLARVHLARGARENQISELSEALRLDPKLLAARIDLAHTYTTGHSAKGAIDLLNQAPPEQLHNVDLIVERNVAWMSQNDSVELRKGIDEGLAISHDPRLVLQDGLYQLQQKNYREGRALLEQVLEQRPEEWSAVEALAKSYRAEKNNAQAIETVRKYVSRVPNSPAGQQLLGSALLQNGDISGARSAFQEAKRLNPRSSAGDFGLVKVAVKEGKSDVARDLLNGIVTRDPHNAEALMLLADAEIKGGHTAAAIGYYNRVLQDNPNEILALNNLAFILADTDTDPDRALALAQKAKELSPENTAVDDTIGWAYYQKGEYREALAHLAKAENGTNVGGKCHLAMVYIKLGDRNRGMSILGDILKENPSSPEAKKALELMASR